MSTLLLGILVVVLSLVVALAGLILVRRLVPLLATQLPEANSNQLQQQSRSYAEAVVDKEWPLLARGQASQDAQNAADKLRESIDEFQPRTMAEQELYARMLTKVDELEENRGLRLLQSQEGVPPLVWAALVILGIITVAFTYLFGMDTPRLHMVRVALLTVVVAVSLYTIHTMEYPFVGGVQLGPEAFERVLDRPGGVGEQ